MSSESTGHEVGDLIAAEPARRADKPELGGWMQRLCRAATGDLAVTGVGMCVMSPQGAFSVLAGSSPLIEDVEQLQFTLGEGPCLDAYSYGRPVLTPDLSQASTRWPGYVPAAQQAGVRAVFSFPLQVGAARMGAMDVFHDRSGSLSHPSVHRALAFAHAAMSALVGAQERSERSRSTDPPVLDVIGSAIEESFLVYQAQGMVQVQLGASLAEAMARLRAHAYASGVTLNEVAADVVARRIRFEPDD